MAFNVHVVNNKGDGIKGVRVVLAFTGLLRGMTSTEYTNSDGNARFDGYDEGEIEVFVDGSNCGKYRYKNGMSITIRS